MSTIMPQKLELKYNRTSWKGKLDTNRNETEVSVLQALPAGRTHHRWRWG